MVAAAALVLLVACETADTQNTEQTASTAPTVVATALMGVTEAVGAEGWLELSGEGVDLLFRSRQQ